MTRVVTFDDYQPLVRFDSIPWTKVNIWEGASQNGPWIKIDMKNISPVDADPSNPAVRSFTTSLAALPVGAWYYLEFEDAFSNKSPTAPEQDAPSPAASYLPLVSDVGALLRARTKDRYGNEVGTFNENTRPTFDEVQRLIETAAGDVTDLIDYDIPLESYRAASGVIALGAAMLVELSYFPEQVAADKSAYQEYKDLYDAYLERLLAAVEREAAEEVTGEVPTYGNMAAFGFPTVEALLPKRM
jgi:hypothetical protein